MTIKAVTSAQLDLIRKTATDKGIGKEDFQKYGIDGGIIARALDAIKVAAAPVETPKLLKFLRSVPVPAVENFVAAEAFGDNNLAGLKFWMNDDFRKHFLGKTENNVPAAELNINELMKASKDDIIRKELGAKHEETKLAHFYELLKSKSGWFVAYIYDKEGNLWAVYASWNAHYRGWLVHASAVADPGGWGAGCQFVSGK